MGSLTYWVGPAINLCPGSSFEVDSNSDGISDHWLLYDSQGVAVASRVSGGVDGQFAQRISWAVNNTGSKGFFLGGGPDGVLGGWKAKQTYLVSWYARATGSNIGQIMQLGWNTPPTQTLIQNPSLSLSWQLYSTRILWGTSVEVAPAGGLYITIAITAATQGTLDIDAVQVEPGDTGHNYQLT